MHRRAVAACQERLQRLAATPGAYDRFYAELKEVAARPPTEAAAALTDLQARMDAELRA